MPFMALWLGVVIFGLGAIFSLLSAIRTMQKSRRWSDYRLRRRYVVQAQTSLVISFLLGSIAGAIFLFYQGRETPSAPAGPFPTVTSPATLTSAPTATGAPTETPSEVPDTPTATAFTPTLIIPPTLAVTATPALPIAVEAMVEGTATPVYELDFGRLRFSTEIADYRLVAPGEAFHNPIKHMYAVFTYQPIGVKVQWTALWYQNGELKNVDTSSWSSYPAGIGVVDWARDPSEWQAGDYELQIFVGTGWKISGRFALEGEPPTVTATLPPSPTASATLTFTASPTSTSTRTPTSTPTNSLTPVPSNTPTATETWTPSPSATSTFIPSNTPTASATFTASPSATATPVPSPTATNTATATPTPKPTDTPQPRIVIPPSPTATSTATHTRVPPSATMTPSLTLTPTASPTFTFTPLPTATHTPTDTAAPTPTPSPTASFTPTASPTFTFTPLPTATHTPTDTAAPPPTPTLTPSPTASFTPSPTFTLTPSLTPTNTATATATWTPSLTPTNTASATPRPTSTFTPSPTSSPTITPTSAPISVSVFFTNTISSAAQAAPFNEPVTREIPGSADPLRAVLDAYFRGPTVDEQARGLIAVYDGYATYRKVELADGILSVYLAGNCRPSGTDYTIFQPLAATLRQFQGVQVVRIYDEYDHTREAVPNVNSWPACLDVRFTSTPTASATSTATPLPSATPTASNTPTETATHTITPSPTNTATFTPVPTSTPLPTATNTSSPTPTPVPSPTTTSLPTLTFTATYTLTPSLTPSITPSPTASSTSTPSRTPTITASPTASNTPTKTFTPSATWTASPTLTLTPINAPTQAGLASPTLAVTPGPSPTIDVACDHAEFLGDVTIFDNAVLQPGETFTKTWRIRNAGSCPWTAAYKLVFVRGDQMAGPSEVPLASLVVSGQTVDIDVNLTAPPVAGEYQGFWQLQAPNGTTFGIGPAATGSLWVKIMVIGTAASPAGTLEPEALTQTAGQMTMTAAAASPTPTAVGTLLPSPAPRVTAELATSACTAQWQGNDGLLDCPGQENDSRGYVIQTSQVALEDGTTASGPMLLTVPADAPDGYILGLFPQIEVQNGDHFLARVGCQQNAPACSVLFRLSYLDTSGAAHDLWTLGEFYDGHLFDLDADLSSLAGQQIRPVLSVNNLGSAVDDRAVWINPRIVHEQPAAPALPTAATATARPASATATATVAAPTTTPAQPEIVPTPGSTPVPPIPQFFNSVVNFFRQLFGGR
jgi:hypothetical protein